MKKAVILFIIFLIILGAGIAEHFFVHKTFDAFNERIGKIEAALQNDDVDSALAYAEDLQNFWAKKRKLVEAISYCQDARQVNVILGELTGSLRCEDIDNAFSKIESLYQLIQNIRDMLDFNAIDII